MDPIRSFSRLFFGFLHYTASSSSRWQLVKTRFPFSPHTNQNQFVFVLFFSLVMFFTFTKALWQIGFIAHSGWPTF